MTGIVKSQEPGALAPANASPPVFALFQQALDKGTEGAGAMETLYKLYTAEREHGARISFAHALAKFQSECPPVPRDTLVDFVSKSGARIHYRSANLETIIETVRPHLLANGFSFTFDSEAGAMHTERCTLQHQDGHSVTSSFTLPTGNNNPGMSDQQKAAGASTFGKRQCLISVLGLALTDPDPDNEGDPSTVTDAEAADLEALAQEVGADRVKFLGWLGVESFAAIPARDYKRAVGALQAKRRAK